MLSWVPGFDGGMPQYFRLRYRPKGSSYYNYHEVYEPGVHAQSVSGLQLDTEYYFNIMSFNNMGDSKYRGEFVRARTLSKSKQLNFNLICLYFSYQFFISLEGGFCWAPPQPAVP